MNYVIDLLIFALVILLAITVGYMANLTGVFAKKTAAA